VEHFRPRGPKKAVDERARSSSHPRGERGFGTELIERGIRFELQGEAKLGELDGGFYYGIVIWRVLDT